MHHEAIARYRDMLDHWVLDPEALCWTVTFPLTGTLSPKEVVTRMGMRPRDLGTSTDEDNPIEEGYFLIEQAGSGIVTYDMGGYGRFSRQIHDALTPNARHWCVQWDSYNLGLSYYQGDGGGGGWDIEYFEEHSSETVTAALGPLVKYADLFQRYNLDDDEYGAIYIRALCLAVVEWESGISLDREWLYRPHPVLDLPARFMM
ncbi:hypothetical protein [Streptosporangium sp. NPDC087985]|uniref:hypothetical protein n=1 Tax=Streptosporangium sp. NPDC087985 TaxID=3366196 RepID=UPI003819F2AB